MVKMMEIISFLPQEIILNIFTRLPVKSIGQCRCVSKSWHAYLSQRSFAKTKFLQQSLILLSGTEYLYTIPLTHEIIQPAKKLNFMGHPDPWDNIFAVCDGLVLLQDDSGDVFLVNPVTREIRQVPDLPSSPNIKDCYNKYGVGYDSVNDDYKIVILSYYRPCLAPEGDDDDDDDVYDKVFVNVFSIKNGTWTAADCSPYVHGHDDSPIPGLFVNGYIHWIAYDAGGSRYVIAAFDVVTERFSVVPPPDSWGKSDRSNLVGFGGDLCVYEGTDYWIMKEYGNKDSWTQVKLKVHEGDFRPLCMLSARKMVLLEDEETDEDAKFVEYDLDKETLRDIVIDGDSDEETFVAAYEGSEGPRFCRETFIESLVSPHWNYTT